MTKVKLIADFNARVLVDGEVKVVDIASGTLIKVTEEIAIRLCNEDVGSEHPRIKKAIRTGTLNLLKPHEDYTWL